MRIYRVLDPDNHIASHSSRPQHQPKKKYGKKDAGSGRKTGHIKNKVTIAKPAANKHIKSEHDVSR